MLLQSDGEVKAVGNNDDGQCIIPEPEADEVFTQVAAGAFHTVLLQSDGKAKAAGNNDDGQCIIPETRA